MILAQESGGSAVSSLLFFFVLIIGMYLLLIRPQRARAKQLATVRSSLQPGSRVVTSAGLHATVAAVNDDGTVVLEIAPGVRVVFATLAVVELLDQPASAAGDHSG